MKLQMEYLLRRDCNEQSTGNFIACMCCMQFVCITAKILDWYNPYMNFTGHIWGIQMVLYLAVIILGATRTYFQTKHRRKHACNKN